MSMLATMLVSTDVLPEHAANEHFHYLQELIDVLPDEQELLRRLDRSEAAQKVMGCQRELSACQTVLIKAEEAVAAARLAMVRAREAGDTTAFDAQEQELLFHSEQLGPKIALVEAARATLQQALVEGGFLSVEQAEGAVLAPEEEITIAAQIASYQRQYATAFFEAEAKKMEHASGAHR